MSDTTERRTDIPDSSGTDMDSALFANLVLQQTQMAMMLMGSFPHPETGKTFRDLERARLLIDQLEMLERKTRGNLTRDEAELLKQSLMNLRMGFVAAVESPEAKPETEPQAEAAKDTADAAAEEESRKKFSKKY